MNSIVLIAWRNLWRNKRRSWTTMASVILAVILALIYYSLKQGPINLLIDNTINRIGHITVAKSGYHDNQSINSSIPVSKELLDTIYTENSIENIVTKLQNYLLLSTGERTKISFINGVNPTDEDNQTVLSEKVICGAYFTSESDIGILIAEDLAQYLRIDRVSCEGEVVLYGSGYQGISVALTLPIRGIVKMPSPEENKISSYITLTNAQEIFSPYVPNLASTLSVYIEDDSQIDIVQRGIIAQLSDQYEALKWNQVNEELEQQILAEQVAYIVIVSIIYLIVGLGMFGSVLMNILERRKEIVIMHSLGMSRSNIFASLMAESIFSGLVGVSIGMFISFIFLGYFYLNPIPLSDGLALVMESYNLEPFLFFELNPYMFIKEALTVFSISVVISIYPIWYASKFNYSNTFH